MLKMVKRKFSLFLFLLFLPTLGYCETKVIAFAQDNLSNNFRKAQVDEARNVINEHKDIKFIFSDAKAKTSLMVHQIEEFIRQKVDVIIIGTSDENVIAPLVEKAQLNNIAVVLINRKVNTKNYTAFLGVDNIEVGRVGALHMAKTMKGKGKILLLEGLATTNVTKERSKGFLDEIKKYQNIEVVRATGDFLRKNSIFAVENLLKNGVKIDAIFAQNEAMLDGAKLAMKKHGICMEEIISMECSFTKRSKEAILNGTQTASIRVPLLGKESANIAIDIINGKKVKKDTLFPTTLITKENINELKPVL